MPGPTQHLGRTGLFFLLVLVFGARLLVLRSVHIYDDAFITYRYAANFAAGHGLVFQPGADWEPVLGTTTPGYAVWLAFWIWLGVEATFASLATNLLCDALSAGLILHLLRERPLAAVLAGLGFACMPELARISCGGMESPMLLLAVLGTGLAWERGRGLLAGCLATLACSLRPEAVLAIPILFFSAPRARHARHLLGTVLILGGIAALALWSYYGNFIPQSVLAKASRHGGIAWTARWAEILSQAYLPRLLYLPALLLALAGTPACWRKLRGLALPMRLGQAIVVSYLVARPHTWGWYYYLPLTTWVLAAAVGVDVLHSKFSFATKTLPWIRRLPYGLAPAVLLLLWVFAPSRDLVRERVYKPLQSWAQDAKLASGSKVVLASDIGALGYFGAGRVLDSEGLVWPEAVPYKGAQLPLIRAYRPDYLWITATKQKLAPLRADKQFLQEYRPIRRFSARGASELDPPLERLATSWVQDYLLFERVGSGEER